MVCLGLEEALARLAGAGFSAVDVLRTCPPWPGKPAGVERVIRQRVNGSRVELVVAAEEYYRERP
ncbi:MAG: hypothetical protein RDU89_05100 [bacterium]|nr:hypothetical protein [bacterium]